MTRNRLAALICIATIAMSGCGGDGSEPTTDQTPTSEEPSEEDPTAEEPPPAASLSGGQAACEDPTGDNVAGPGDLTSVTLVSDDDVLNVTFTTAVPLDTAFYTLLVASEDGNTAKQIGFRLDGGTVTEHFIFDSGEAQNTNLDSGVTIDGATATGVFPLDDLADLGSPFTWRGFLSVNSEDVDECPEPGDDSLNPVSLTFPE